MKAFAVKALVTPEGIDLQEQEWPPEYKHVFLEGSYLRATFELWDDKRSDDAFRYFHKLRDRYAEAMGYDKNYAKAELKHLWGVTVPYSKGFQPPKRTGRFVELYGQIEFQISTNAYRKGEFTHLIEGTKQACYENGIDISDLETRQENEKL